MILFAKVFLDLSDHPRAHQAGAAMATWTWGLLYTRKQELDGYVPFVALRGAWVGEEQARKDVETLIAAGLCESAPGGFAIARYAEKNETKTVIAERREGERLKKARWREQHAMSTRESTTVSPVDRIPLSDSPPERSETETKTETGHPGESPVMSPVDTRERPAWFDGAIETVEMNCGETLDRAAAWIRYSADRREKSKRMSSDDAQRWLVTVDLKEARQARERRRTDPRQIKQQGDENAPWRKEGA